jgi:hypothetical protein
MSIDILKDTSSLGDYFNINSFNLKKIKIFYLKYIKS